MVEEYWNAVWTFHSEWHVAKGGDAEQDNPGKATSTGDSGSGADIYAEQEESDGMLVDGWECELCQATTRFTKSNCYICGTARRREHAELTRGTVERTSELAESVSSVSEEESEAIETSEMAEKGDESEGGYGGEALISKAARVPQKYWAQRHRLFSLFDQGIKLDHESWFSVTPEAIARHIAESIGEHGSGEQGGLVLVDAFCGSGGNSIAFASVCEQVISIDIDPRKIQDAKHNAEIYGVADRIEFICGDFFQVLEGLKADILFLSPPWGGPDYLKAPEFRLDMIEIGGRSGVDLHRLGLGVAENIVHFLPRNTPLSELALLESQCGVSGRIRVERHHLNGKLKTLAAYFGPRFQSM